MDITPLYPNHKYWFYCSSHRFRISTKSEVSGFWSYWFSFDNSWRVFEDEGTIQLRKKAGFVNLVSTSRLQIVEGQKLVKDGLYKHVRHPLYLGEILRNFGIVSIFSSGYGIFLIMVGAIFLLFRIKTEEEMLVEAFGSDYEDYKRRTKRLIPYIY